MLLLNKQHKFLNLKGKIFLTENKDKLIAEDDFFGDGHIISAASIADENSFYSIDSLSKTITRIYTEPVSYLDQFKALKNDNSKKIIFDQLLKTDSIATICGAECRKFLFYQKLQDQICKTEYFITTKYGTKFKLKHDILKNGYGIALKRVVTNYKDERMKDVIIRTVITVTLIKEMEIDQKEFDLPEGWPIHSVNVTPKLKNTGF